MSASRAVLCSVLMLISGCQCVQLPTALRCTGASCSPGERCGDDGRCARADAGCTPSTTCAAEGRECGLLDTGCGEEDCGACANGLTCGSVARGVCSPCDPSAADAPDPDFVDTNCDGLDGMVDGGLFIDPQSGSDLNTGTRARPLYSLARAAELVQLDPSIHTVFISQGVTEGGTWRAPVSLAGGYRAPEWLRTRSSTTTLRGRGTGLRLENLPATVQLSLLTIESTPGDAGSASIGLFVQDAPVSLQQLVVRAGDGPPGLRGADGVRGANGGPGGPGSVGSSGQLCSGCGQSPVAGAAGDAGVGPCGEGTPGLTPLLPNGVRTPPPLDVVLLRPTSGPCSQCPCLDKTGQLETPNALDGLPPAAPPASGDAGADGPARVAGTGSLDGGLWLPLAGAAGAVGYPGAPGAPGAFGGTAIYSLESDAGVEARSAALGSSGGGGGAPGCGGQPGSGGHQGGASIGLVVVGLAPRLENVSVIAGRGGAGGAPGAGGPGGLGGPGGAGGPRWTADCELPPLLPQFGLNPPSASPTGISSYFTAGAGSMGGSGGEGGAGGRGSAGPVGPSVGVWCERSRLDPAQLQVLVSGSDGGLAVPAIDCQ